MKKIKHLYLVSDYDTGTYDILNDKRKPARWTKDLVRMLEPYFWIDYKNHHIGEKLTVSDGEDEIVEISECIRWFNETHKYTQIHQ